MRKGIGWVVVVGAVIAPLALARAATEVARFPANNRFATAIMNAADGTSTGVFVTREIGASGGPVDRVSFIISRPNELILFGSGVLPRGAFHIDARSASLEIDINDIALDPLIGSVPEDGVITVDWTATDVQRTSGSSTFTFDTTRVVIAGTSTQTVAGATGTVFGAPLVASSASLSTVTQAVIVITRE